MYTFYYYIRIDIRHISKNLFNIRPPLGLALSFASSPPLLSSPKARRGLSPKGYRRVAPLLLALALSLFR